LSLAPTLVVALALIVAVAPGRLSVLLPLLLPVSEPPRGLKPSCPNSSLPQAAITPLAWYTYYIYDKIAFSLIGTGRKEIGRKTEKKRTKDVT
jgi:hypothetical protein